MATLLYLIQMDAMLGVALFDFNEHIEPECFAEIEVITSDKKQCSA